MPQAVFEVQMAQPPAPNKKEATLMTTGGQKFWLPAGMVGSFRPGGTYEVFYEDREFQGRPCPKILTMKMIGHNTTAAAAQGVVQTAQRPYVDPKGLEIWCNSMMQRAVDTSKIDLWDEEACMELIEVQKRVYRRAFTDDNVPKAISTGQRFIQGVPAAPPPQSTFGHNPPQAHQGSSQDLNDEIPF